MAEIYGITGDNLMILGTRESGTQPFQSIGWLDLRIGMFLSLCPPGVGHQNDPPTGLAEPTVTAIGPSTYMWLGLKDSGPNLPSDGTGSFIGFTNSSPRFLGNGALVSSDISVGNDNTLWRATNSVDGQASRIMGIENGVIRVIDFSIPHFVQNTATRGYTGMIGIRLTRPSSTSNTITMYIPRPTTGSLSCDIAFTNTPTLTQLLSLLDPWPTTVTTLGPVTFGSLPDSLFIFWPFHNSRLRMSVWGILRAA